MRGRINKKVNLLSIFIIVLLAPMAAGYFAVRAVEFALTKR